MEQALCFGWIDGAAPEARRQQLAAAVLARAGRGAPGARSTESEPERLIEQGLMTEQGQAVIDLAKENGRWEPEG